MLTMNAHQEQCVFAMCATLS